METKNDIYQPSADEDTLSIRYLDLEEIRPLVKNFKLHDVAGIAASMQERGFLDPVAVDDLTRENFDGNGRVEALLWLKDQGGAPPAKVLSNGEKWFVPVVFGISFDSEEKRVAAAAALNKLNANGGFDQSKEAALLKELLDKGENLATGYSDDEIKALIEEFFPEGSAGGAGEGGSASGDGASSEAAANSPTLADRFLFPPFSVLDARSGVWQKRKAAWLSLGIKSEEGRGGNLLNFSEAALNPSKVYGKQGKKGAKAEVLPPALEAAAVFAEAVKDLRFFRQETEKRTGEAYEKNKGLLGFSDSGNDPEYYRKKQAVEASLGEEISREEFQLFFYEGSDTLKAGTSIFDPVLCEVLYTWFCPLEGRVLDPFAGGSVRGIVAGRLDRRYTGVDLRKEQVAANIEQAKELLPEGSAAAPRWICGDSLKDQPEEKFDFLFSCPPYFDLEVYSDDPRDLSSAKSFDLFLTAYREIIRQSVERLEDDRFACFVVGEVRRKDGIYHNFVAETVRAFEDAGARYYNEMILVTAVGSLPIRAGRQFASGRKIGKTHQNILCFVKNDGKKAAKNCGDVSVFDFIEAAAASGLNAAAADPSDASDGSASASGAKGIISENDLKKRFEKIEGGEI